MNTSMATGQMAQMKWMMYLMPIMFLGFFNNYAAALAITISLQICSHLVSSIL